MAAYSLDFWIRVLPLLKIWYSLSLEQKETALQLESRYASLGKVWHDLPTSTFNQLFETGTKGLHRPAVAFVKIINLQHRLDIWIQANLFNPTIYIHELTTQVQRQALSGVRIGSSPETHVAVMAQKITEGRFTKMLMESNSHQDFLKSVGHWEPEEKKLSEQHYLALKAWLVQVTEKGTVGCILHNETFSPYDEELAPGELTYLALSYGLAILVKIPTTLEVKLQVICGSKVIPQSTDKCVASLLKPASTFMRPYLLEDMEVYLHSLKTISTMPLSDGRNLPIAHHRRVAKLLLALPSLLPHASFDTEERARAAWWMISALNLVTQPGDRWKPKRFQLSPIGESWLKLSREKKLELILTKAPCGRRKTHIMNEDHLYSWLGDFQYTPIPYHALTDRVFTWMDVAIAHLEEPTEFIEWIRKISSVSNPFLADIDINPELLGQWKRWSRNPQTTYQDLLTRYLARLNSLGAVAFSHDSQGNLGISLTTVGKWLFGLSQIWTLKEEYRPVVLIGADFSVMLTEQDPSLALEISNFSETVMSGTSYRITRASIQESIHHGRTVEEILAILHACSKKIVPKNVVHEIKAWSESKQSVNLSEVILLEGQDPVAIAEIQSRFPNEFVRISPNALKFIGKGKLSDLGKKLTKKGFFLN